MFVLLKWFKVLYLVKLGCYLYRFFMWIFFCSKRHFWRLLTATCDNIKIHKAWFFNYLFCLVSYHWTKWWCIDIIFVSSGPKAISILTGIIINHSYARFAVKVTIAFRLSNSNPFQCLQNSFKGKFLLTTLCWFQTYGECYDIFCIVYVKFYAA